MMVLIFDLLRSLHTINKKMLTKDQNQQKRKHVEVHTYLTSNQTKVNTFNPLKIALKKYGDTIDTLGEKEAAKNQDSTGITVTKNEAKLAVAKYYEGICGSCFMFCGTEANGRTEFKPEFKWSRAAIEDIRDQDLKGWAAGKNTLITDKLIPLAAFAEYGITAGTLAAGLVVAETFDGMIASADGVSNARSGANTTIDGTLDSLNDQLELIAGGMKRFAESDSGFYTGFLASMHIDNLPTSKTGMGGDVFKDGVAVSDAFISAVGLKKNVTTNLLGRYDLERIEPGLYQFTCMHPVHGTLSKVVRVKLGKMVEVDWEY